MDNETNTKKSNKIIIPIIIVILIIIIAFLCLYSFTDIFKTNKEPTTNNNEQVTNDDATVKTK